MKTLRKSLSGLSRGPSKKKKKEDSVESVVNGGRKGSPVSGRVDLNVAPSELSPTSPEETAAPAVPTTSSSPPAKRELYREPQDGLDQPKLLTKMGSSGGDSLSSPPRMAPPPVPGPSPAPVPTAEKAAEPTPEAPPPVAEPALGLVVDSLADSAADSVPAATPAVVALADPPVTPPRKQSLTPQAAEGKALEKAVAMDVEQVVVQPPAASPAHEQLAEETVVVRVADRVAAVEAVRAGDGPPPTPPLRFRSSSSGTGFRRGSSSSSPFITSCASPEAAAPWPPAPAGELRQAEAKAEGDKVAEAAVEAALILAETVPYSPPEKKARIPRTSDKDAAGAATAEVDWRPTPPFRRRDLRATQLGETASSAVEMAPSVASSQSTPSSGAQTIAASPTSGAPAADDLSPLLSTPAAMLDRAVAKVQAASQDKGSACSAAQRWQRGAERSRQVEAELMAAGHLANDRKDYLAARLNFQACYELGAHPVVAQLSAANMALKMKEPAVAVFEYQQVLLRQDLPAPLRLKAVTKLLTAAIALKRAEHQNTWKLPSSFDDIPKLLQQPKWYEAILPPSDADLMSTLDVYDAPIAPPVTPKALGARSAVTPIRTVRRETYSSMPAVSLQAWQRRLLPVSEGGAYPSSGVADIRHGAPWHVGGANGESEAVLAAHDQGAPLAAPRPRRRQRRSGVLEPDRTTPFALLLLFVALAMGLAHLMAQSAAVIPSPASEVHRLNGVPRVRNVVAQVASNQWKTAGRELNRARDVASKTAPWKLAEKAAGTATGWLKPKIEA